MNEFIKMALHSLDQFFNVKLIVSKDGFQCKVNGFKRWIKIFHYNLVDFALTIWKLRTKKDTTHFVLRIPPKQIKIIHESFVNIND